MASEPYDWRGKLEAIAEQLEPDYVIPDLCKVIERAFLRIEQLEAELEQRKTGREARRAFVRQAMGQAGPNVVRRELVPPRERPNNPVPRPPVRD